MEANPEAEGEVGSNDGDNNMPELEPSVEPDPDEENEVEEEVAEEEDDDDDDDGGQGPPLVQQVEPTKGEALEETDEIEGDDDEAEPGSAEEVQAEAEGETAENIVENTENGPEEEEEEEEEEYENEGNPAQIRLSTADDSNDDDQMEEGVDEEDSNENDANGKPSLKSKMGADREPRLIHPMGIRTRTTEKAEAATSDKEASIMTRKRSASLSSSDDGPKRKQGRSTSGQGEQQKGATDRTHDKYCWVCHKDGVYFNCKICPRSYHMRCICLPDYPEPTLPEGDGTSKVCICPECVVVMNAEEVDKRSEAMKQLSMDQLVGMLKQICGRMKLTPGVEPFLKPVQASDACDYYEYIIYPMDIQTLEKNVKQRQYGSTEAFLADAQWIVHNSIIFNSSSSPYTASAKRILKVCKQELSEIETCPECYTNAHTKSDTWFVEACKRPHILVWAKLKGFPFWPAKAMKIKDDQVDVRFFGQHDRAWVYLKDCFLYSEEMPASPPKKNAALLSAIDELNTHAEKLTETHGEVVLASVKTPLGRELSTSEIQRLLPNYKPEELSHKSSSQMATADKENKAQTSASKSPMTITISSIKTNPTIVNNSLSESPPTPADKKSTKLKRPSISSNPSTGEVGPLTRSTRSAAVVLNASTNEQLPTVDAPAEAATTPEEEGDKPAAASSPEPPPSPPPKSDEPPPKEKDEKVSKKELDDDFESRVPSGEILANALGLRRITRKASQTDTVTLTTTPILKSDSGKATAAALTTERRISRPSVPGKPGNATEGEDSDSSQSQLQLQLRKAPKVSVTPVIAAQLQPNVSIKSEPVDPLADDEDEGMMEQDEAEDKNSELPPSRSKTQDFMEHISTQAQTKPGYRFNISKDISISAISQDSEPQDDNKNTSSANNRLRKNFGLGPNVTVNPASLLLPQRQSIPMTVQQQQQQQPNKSSMQQQQIGPNSRPRLNQVLQQQQQQQQQNVTRFLQGQGSKDIRSLTRMLKPANSKTPQPQVSVANVRQNRAVPGAIQMSTIRAGNSSLLHKLQAANKQQPIIVDSTSLRVDNSNQFAMNMTGSNQLQKVGSAIQVNQVQSVQGAITLPGGTITVTPLSLQGGNSSSNYTIVNGDRSLKSASGNSSTTLNNSNGLPMSQLEGSNSNSNNPPFTATPMSAKSTGNAKSNSQSQSVRNKMTNMVPQSVVLTVQGLQKNVNELIRQAAESIAVDMVEHTSSKSDSENNLKQEKEKLMLKHNKELTDMRLNHEILMRELRSNMDTEKKRAVAEIRRQNELEKQKAVEEAKKKQWCAHCLREALFYCCWNTSYCGYPCQEDHWPVHMATCTQNTSATTSSSNNANSGSATR